MGYNRVHLSDLELGDLYKWKEADMLSMLLPHSGLPVWT